MLSNEVYAGTAYGNRDYGVEPRRWRGGRWYLLADAKAEAEAEAEALSRARPWVSRTR